MNHNYRGFSVLLDSRGERFPQFVDLLNWKMDKNSRENVRKYPVSKLTIAREVRIIIVKSAINVIQVENCGFYGARKKEVEINEKQLQKLRELWMRGKNSAWACWKSGEKTIFTRPLRVIAHVRN